MSYLINHNIIINHSNIKIAAHLENENTSPLFLMISSRYNIKSRRLTYPSYTVWSPFLLVCSLMRKQHTLHRHLTDTCQFSPCCLILYHLQIQKFKYTLIKRKDKLELEEKSITVISTVELFLGSKNIVALKTADDRVSLLLPLQVN